MPAVIEKLRKGPFIRALIALVLVLCVELGAHFLLKVPTGEHVQSLAGNPDFLKLQVETGVNPAEVASVSADNPQPPGLAIPYLALIDGLLMLAMIIMVLNLIGPKQTVARLQGIVSVVLMILLILGAIVLAIVALVKLILMVSLFVSAPFGTLAYLALFGSFDTGGAGVALALILALKVAFCIQLVWGQQRFLQMKGFVALVVTSIVLTLVIGFLYGLVPFVLVSIIDAVAALVIAIVAIIWAIVLLVGGVIGAVRAIA